MPQGPEQLRYIPHAANLFPAGSTGTQVRVDFPKVYRLQRTGQVLFEAFHHYRVHKRLPLQL